MPDSDDWVPMPPPDDDGWDGVWMPVPKPSGNLEKKTSLVVILFFYKIMNIQDQVNLMKLIFKILSKYIQT